MLKILVLLFSLGFGSSSFAAFISGNIHIDNLIETIEQTLIKNGLKLEIEKRGSDLIFKSVGYKSGNNKGTFSNFSSLVKMAILSESKGKNFTDIIDDATCVEHEGSFYMADFFFDGGDIEYELIGILKYADLDIKVLRRNLICSLSSLYLKWAYDL
jgi:hypothetical protein